MAAKKKTPRPPLTENQRLLLMAVTVETLSTVLSDYHRHPTQSFSQQFNARFREAWLFFRERERVAAIQGGLLDLAEEQMVPLWGGPCGG